MAHCIRAVLLALCLIHGNAALAQYTNLHVGMSKLSAVAAFVSMVASEETPAAEKVEEGGQVEDKVEHEAKTDEGELQNDVAEGAEDGEALLEEAEEDEEGDQEEESMDEEEEEGEEDDEMPKPQDVMEELDINKDKHLSLAEVMTEQIPKEAEESLTEAFNRFDHNKDNKIDSDELPALVEEVHKKKLIGLVQEDTEDEVEEDEDAPENPADVMKDLDTDKDGVLTFTELVGKEDEANLMEQDSRSIKEVFEASDKNKDGKLDMQELPSALEEMDKRDL